jgi:Glycosyl transferases group 1
MLLSALPGGMPSIWQNPNSQHLDALMVDGGTNRVVIDVDDPYHQASPKYAQANADAHINCLQGAAALIVANEALAEAYAGMHDDIRVIPTCVDPLDWNLGRQMNHLDGKLRIGYAAGDRHAEDAALLGEALAQISEHEGVIVEFVGSFDPGWDFPYVRYPALPYPAYKAMLATWSIGLAPLTPSEINLTRTDLKFLDYAMSGAVCICSPVGPYAPLVEDGIVCSAESPQEWYEVLRELVEKDDTRQKLGLHAYNYCRVERHPANQRVAYLDALGLRRSHVHA